jgi:hypothetical protein
MNEIDLMLRAALVSLFFGFFAHSLHGQNCKEMVYGHQNQIDRSPIELRQIKGKVLDPSGTVLPQVCVGIFTEPEHKLVRYAQTDQTGLFALDTTGLPDGEYRFVGQSPGFCPANARIWSKSRSHQTKTLVVHMNVRGIDTCSYVERSKK